MRRALKRIAIGLAALAGLIVAMVAVTVLVAGLRYRINGRQRTAAGAQRVS